MIEFPFSRENTDGRELDEVFFSLFTLALQNNTSKNHGFGRCYDTPIDTSL